MSELTTNAVTHGAGPVTLTLSTDDQHVRVEVENEGSGTPVMPWPESSHRILGGWGLHLVDTVADDWGVDADADTTAVWFERALQTEDD